MIIFYDNPLRVKHKRAFILKYHKLKNGYNFRLAL